MPGAEESNRPLSAPEFAELRRLGDGVKLLVGPDLSHCIWSIVMIVDRLRIDQVAAPAIARALGVDPPTLADWQASFPAEKPRHALRPPAGTPLPPLALPVTGGEALHREAGAFTLSSSHSGAISDSQSASASDQLHSGNWRPGSATRGERVLVLMGHPSVPGPGPPGCPPVRFEFDREARALMDVLRYTTTRAILQPRVSPYDLGQLLREHAPLVVHVAAHADRDGVQLTDAGAPVAVAESIWCQAIDAGGHIPAVAILNYCRSSQAALALAAVVPSVVSWRTSPNDDQAIDFAGRLYDGLAQGLTLGQSFRAATDAVNRITPELTDGVELCQRSGDFVLVRR